MQDSAPAASPAAAQQSAKSRVVQPSTVREESGDRMMPDTGEIPVVQKSDGRVSADPNDPEVAKAIRHEHIEQRKITRDKHRRSRIVTVLCIIVALLALAGCGWGAYAWSQTQYYLGSSNGVITIYQGVNTNLFGLELSHEVKSTNITISSLPQSWQNQLEQGIAVGSYDEAQAHAKLIERERDKEQNKTADSAKKSTDSSSDKAGDSSGKSTSSNSGGNSGKSSDGNSSGNNTSNNNSGNSTNDKSGSEAGQ